MQNIVDFLVIGRGLLADLFIPQKLSEGRPDDIRPCIGCNEGCVASVSADKAIDCSVNPAVGREKAAKASKRILVMGGGPGGMQLRQTHRKPAIPSKYGKNP